VHRCEENFHWINLCSLLHPVCLGCQENCCMKVRIVPTSTFLTLETVPAFPGKEFPCRVQNISIHHVNIQYVPGPLPSPPSYIGHQIKGTVGDFRCGQLDRICLKMEILARNCKI
jgi:hypothetical protein